MPPLGEFLQQEIARKHRNRRETGMMGRCPADLSAASSPASGGSCRGQLEGELMELGSPELQGLAGEMMIDDELNLLEEQMIADEAAASASVWGFRPTKDFSPEGLLSARNTEEERRSSEETYAWPYAPRPMEPCPMPLQGMPLQGMPLQGSMPLASATFEQLAAPGVCNAARYTSMLTGFAPPSSLSLHDTFASLVMCDFTPRSPTELPALKWVSST